MAKQNQKAQEPSGTSFPKGNVVITGDKYYDTGTERQKFFSGDGVSKTQPGDNDGISMPIPFSIPFVPNVPPAKKTQEQVKPATVNTKKAEDIDATLQSNGIPIVKITSTSSDSPDSVKRKIEESVKEVNKRVRDVQKDINNPTVKKNVDNLAGDYFISAINAPVSVDDAFRQQTQSQEEIAKRIQQESYVKAQQAVSKSNDVFKELGGIEANQFPLAKMWNTGATSIPTSIVSNDDATEYIKDNNLSDIKAVDNFKILNDAVASGNVDYKSILGKVSEKSSKYQEFLNDQSYKKSVSDAVKTSKEIQELNATVQKQRKELAATGDMGVFFKTSKEIEDASKAIAEVYKNDAQAKEYIETSAALEEEYGKLSTIIQEIPAETKEKIKKADEAILKLENESPKDENGNAIIPDDKIQEYNDNAKIKNDIIESLSIKPINEKIKSLELKLGKVKDSKSVLDVKQQLAELSKKKEAVKELFVKAKKQEDEYTTTDKNEIALKNLLEKYRKQQIKIDEIKANSWIAMIYDKYKGNIDEGIIFNEYTNAVNAFNYEEFVKAKLAPVLPEKMNPKLKQVLQSQDYLYSTVQQKIVALSYYWHHNATGKSETDFIQSMKGTIRMPIHIQALIGTMIQYKKEIDKERELEQKTSGLSSPELPKFLKGAGLAAMAMPDIRTHNYDIPSDEKTARQLFDVIYDRIMSLPQQPAGVVSDFFYGLSKTEAKDTIPFLGSLIGSVEQIELNRILKKPNFSRTKEEIRVVDAIGALSAIAHSLNQVKLTPYTLGNVAVPNLIKLVAEFAAFNSMGVAGVAVGEGNVATVFDNIITYGLILSGMEGKGVRALTTVGKEVATAFLKGGMITPVTFALGGAGTFYELSNQHVEAMFNYEDCKWENKEEHLKNTESNAMVFLDALGTHIIQNSTMYMGHFAERGVSKATKGIVNAFTKDLSILKSNPETKAATQSFISLITEPQTKKAYSEAIAYKVFNALSPYLRWVAKDNKQVFFGQLNGAVGLTSISLYNRILVDTLERELNISDNDFDFDIKEEFLNSIYTLAPLAFLHAGTSFTLGTLNRGIKGIAYQEYRPDFFDISATNTDITNVSAKNAMFIFPDYLRSDFKIFKSILKDIINATSDSYLEKSKYDNIISNIEKLQQKGEHKLSVILGNLVELRNKFEDSGIENMSFKEYMQSFESEYKSVKSVEAQVMASGKLDIDYYNDVMSKLKFERNIDNLEHIKKVYDEYNLQVEQGLIPSTKTFLEFSQIEILKLKRLEDSIERYIASPGDNPAPNFEITAKLIQDCIASDQKKEYLNNILDEAKRVYKTRDNILVEGIVFVNDEVKLGHTDKPDIDLEPTKDPDGNLVPSGFKTTGLKDKDGNVFDIEATTDGTVMFSDKNTDAVDFMNFVATNMNNLTNKVRLAIFLTLHKNDSLTEPQKYELLQRVYNGLAERAKGTDTTAYSIVKQLAVIDKALKLINKTFAGKSDEGGANPLDGKVILDMLKSRYNIDPESRTYILDRVDYISIFDIINGVAKFSNIISSRKIENLKNRIIIGDYTPKERILDDEISTLNPIRDKKIISERDIRKYLEPVVKDNPNFTKEQVNALVNVIKYYSYNLVRMGIIKNTADIFKNGILPEMKLWNVTRRFTLANIAKNPDILFQAIGEKGAKRVKEIYDKRLLAEKLKQKGYTELGIKQLTGWEYDAFLGEWIFETNDSDIKLNFPENKVNVLDSGDGFTIKMGDLLGIDYEIFKYYPKLRDLNVTFTTKLPENTRGTYTTTLSGKSLGIALRIGNIGADVKLDKNTIEDIVLKNTSTDSDSHAQWKSTLLHEIQHFIQTEEAFPNGTSVEAIKPLVEEYLNKKDGISIDDIESGMYDTEIESIAYNLYLRTFGEIQARSSAERLQMTPEERAISLFTQHTGIPDSEKIKIINTAIVKNLANQETYKLEKEKLFQVENNIDVFNHQNENENKLLQVEDDYIRGMYDHANNVITILKNGKIDTLMHELGHSFRFILKEYAEKGNAKAKEYMDAFDDFAMSEEGKKFFDSQEFKGEHNLDNFQFINEFFARSFESYLHDGGKGGDGLKITDMNVRRLLSHFKEWMKEIYGAVKSGAIKIKLTKEVRDVFESLIGNKNKLFDLETYIETAYGRLSIRENIDKKVVVDIIEQMKNNILDPDTRKASLDYLHKIFEAYKKQYIGQRYKGNSRLINPDLMKLIKTPKFSTPEGYEKHMKLFEAIISNSRFKFAWQQMNRFRESAVKNVYAKRRTNVEFYNLLMRLARVNPEFIGISEDGVRTKIGELESYNRLLQTTPSDMGILDFTKRVEYYEEKSKQYEAEVAQERLNNSAEAELNGIDINDTYEPYTPSDYEVMQLRKGREEVTSKARDYAIQQGKVDITKPTESEFFSLDISDMTDAELKRYGEILSTISRSPEGYTVGPEVVNLIVDINSRKAEELIQQDISDFWRKKLREINNSWQRSHGTALRSLSNRFLNPYGFGALSNYNLKDALNFLDGIREDYGGVMVQTIFAPLEANSDRMRTTLNNVFTNINQFKGNKDSNMNLTLGQFNKIGVYWLLSQKPDIKISKDDFEYFRDEIENINTNVFEDAGIDIVDAKKLLMPGDVLSADMFYVKDKNGVYEQRTDMKESDAKLFEIYTKLLDLRLKHIKDSIIISHGERPEGMSDVDYNRHIKIMTNSTDIMMAVSGHQVEKLGTDGWADVVRSHVRDKRLQLLSATGHNSVAELVESKIELNDREKEFYGIGVSLFDRLQSGEFTDGRTMKETSDAYTNNQDSPYESVRNYAPMLRFNESKIEGSEAFEDEAGKVRPDYQFRTRNNLSTSTQFLKSRKRSITSLNTNAFEMIEKRFDQELFYMLNEPHRVFLNGLFKKEIFNKTDYDKKVDDGTIDNISLDYIKNNISVYYRRGITAGKMAIKDDKLLSKMMNMIDDFKIVALSPIRQSFGQVTSGFISQANLYGDPLRRFTDLSNGYADIFNPLSGQKVSDMIQNYAPEVAFRGLSDYDLGTQRVSPKMKDLYKRYWNGEFKHEKGYFGELINSFKDRRGANQRALLPMIYFDRLAARATFMGAYRNYCFHNGLELNFDLPDADAIKFAINVVRKSQSTDNELFKPGVLNGIRAQENYNPYDTSFTENSAYAELFRKGYWNFKSFSLAEKNNIAIKMIKAFRGEGSTLAEKSDAIASLAYSFTGSMLYDMSKSFFKAAFSSVGLYIGYMVGLNGKGPSSRDDDKNFIIDLIKGEFGDINVKDKDASDAATGAYRSSIQNNLTWNKEEGNLTDTEGTKEALVYGLVKNAVQQFGINEVGQAALSMALLGLQRARMKPNELPGRMDKMLTQSEELNLLGMMTDVFNPQILTGEKINSKSYVNDLYEFGRAIVSDEYNVTPDMWTTATQFGASAAGMGTFSRLPMSYPSIHQWIKDNNSYRKMIQKDYENTGVNPTPTETGIINEQNSKQQDDNTSDE